MPRTALDCLSKIATHHGVDLPVERLRHAYALDGTPVSANLLLRMAKDAGLRAQSTRIDWSALFPAGRGLSGAGAVSPTATGSSFWRQGRDRTAWSPSRSSIRSQSARMRR